MFSVAQIGRGVNWAVALSVDALVRDARYGIRRLVRDWRFTAAAILILGLGIGANTAIFSLINATLFRRRPMADPDRLVDIYQNGTNAGGLDANSYPAYLDMAEYTDVFASTTAVLDPSRRELPGTRAPCGRRSPSTRSATYLSVLGLRPSLGRWFNAGRGCARRRCRRRHRTPGVDEEIPCRSVRDRPHHPDRRRAGHDRGRWPRRPPTARSTSASSPTSGCRSRRSRRWARRRVRWSGGRRRRLSS